MKKLAKRVIILSLATYGAAQLYINKTAKKA